MNASRGRLYFHRLFSVQELGLGNNPEPFINRVIREFLKIGEAVAGRWIEMPQGVLLLQMAPDRPDSGAVYLYDRKQQVFYMLGFDGADDNLTLAEFNQLLDDYGLLRYAERPSLMHAQPPMPEPEAQLRDTLILQVPVHQEVDLLTANGTHFTTKHGVRWYAGPSLKQFHLQSAGSA